MKRNKTVGSSLIVEIASDSAFYIVIILKGKRRNL
jgi:hypothetical protein